MEGTGDVRFGRSAFGGFNRRDVMDYIDKLQRSAAAKGGDLQALSQVSCERDALEQENRRLREEIVLLRAQLSALRSTAEAGGEASDAQSDESFTAAEETVSDADAKSLSLRDVDEMVQKYFG